MTKCSNLSATEGCWATRPMSLDLLSLLSVCIGVDD